jgi:hypothetical protein
MAGSANTDLQPFAGANHLYLPRFHVRFAEIAWTLAPQEIP